MVFVRATCTHMYQGPSKLSIYSRDPEQMVQLPIDLYKTLLSVSLYWNKGTSKKKRKKKYPAFSLPRIYLIHLRVCSAIIHKHWNNLYSFPSDFLIEEDWNMLHFMKLSLSLVLWDSLYLMSIVAEHNIFHYSQYF